MKFLKRFMRAHDGILFAAGGTVIVLWQMLLPGYVLTWDMVFGPSHVFPDLSGLLNSLPLTLLLWGAGFLMPVWLVQKILLVSLFFCLFYFPIRFFPFKAIEAWARYAAATFYAINPFVYERFLAGHWNILCAYALLPPFLFFLFELVEKPTKRGSIFLAFTMLLVGVFSLHVFVMTVLIATVLCAVALIRKFQAELLRYVLLASALVAIFSLYWVVPLFFHPASSPVPVFGQAHWKAFETSADPVFRLSGNVLALYGFWGESYPWMQSLLSPKSAPIIFFPSLAAIFLIVVLGAISLFRSHESRGRASALLVIAAAAFVFSLGVAPTIFAGFNTWLLEHVPFWAGFRDTQKWSMWLALSYAYFFAAGSADLVSKLATLLPRGAKVALVLLPCVYTFTMLGSFAGQLRAVDYPRSWYEVNTILAKDRECTALFLPWHQYYPLSFNHSMLTANTASRFFDCAIISSLDAEIGAIGDQGNADPVYQKIASVVTKNDSQNLDETLRLLREAGIRYIIFTDDAAKYDGFSYPFLHHPTLELIYSGGTDDLHIDLMRI